MSCLPAPLDKAALTALARQALLDYGAQEVDGVLRCRYASLFHHDGWANFAELATEDCWAWYHDLLQATLSTEEFQARYTSPNDFPGWFFPEEELESAVLRTFEIQPWAIRRNSCTRIPGIMTRNTGAISSPAAMGAAASSRRCASAPSPRRGTG